MPVRPRVRFFMPPTLWSSGSIRAPLPHLRSIGASIVRVVELAWGMPFAEGTTDNFAGAKSKSR